MGICLAQKAKRMGVAKVSVIVPCYNVGEMIRLLLLSIEQQDYENFEVLFVDDGSTDDTLSILQKFINNSSPNLRHKLKLIEKTNGGVGSARNVGLDAADGDLIFFVDGDDFLLPKSLSKLAELMTEGVDITVGAYEDNEYFVNSFPHIDDREKWLQATIAKGALTLWNKMFRRSIIEKNNLRFDTTTKKSEDHLFTAEYLANSKGRIAVTDYPVYHYVFNPMSVSNISMTTNTFAPWIADSVYVAVRIYKLLENHLSKATLRELRYDTYHKYRRIRHEAHVHQCKDKLFYDNIYAALRSVMPVREIVWFAIRRRVSIIYQSAKRKIRKRWL